MTNTNNTFESHCAKRVSYTLATKNRAAFLEKALDNCRKFLDPRDELIVIDGASTDNTREVVEKNADIIDVFVSEPDLKGAHGANKAILLARGLYVKPLTDDDDFYPEAMKQAVKVLEAHPEIDLLLCGGSVKRGEHIGYIYVPPGVDYGRRMEDFFRYPRSGGSQFFKRKIFANIGLIPLYSSRPDGELTFKSFYSGACIRFSRINLFRHYSDIHQGTPLKSRRAMRKERNKFLFAAAKESCPPSFYWKYIIITTIQGSALFRMLRKARRIFYRISGISNRKGLAVEKYIWDGGLS